MLIHAGTAIWLSSPTPARPAHSAQETVETGATASNPAFTKAKLKLAGQRWLRSESRSKAGTNASKMRRNPTNSQKPTKQAMLAGDPNHCNHSTIIVLLLFLSAGEL